MIKATVIAALSIPVFCAAATGEYAQHLATARQQAATWQNKLTQVSTELKELGVDLSSPGPQAEIPETEDTVAVADKGLLFDTATSRVIYLGISENDSRNGRYSCPALTVTAFNSEEMTKRAIEILRGNFSDEHMWYAKRILIERQSVTNLNKGDKK